MNIKLIGGSSCYSSIGVDDIYKCITAKREKDVTSLWGKIADWFIGTEKEAAKIALFRLSNADTAAQQLFAFSELKRYVAPAWQDSLTWQINANDYSAFRIGVCNIPCHVVTETDIEDPPAVDPDSACRLLCSMHYAAQNVVKDFHRFAVAHSLDRTADLVLENQIRFLNHSPGLLDALRLIGLDKNDPQGDLAYETSQKVERMVYQMYGDDEIAAYAGRNAENLSIAATECSGTQNLALNEARYPVN